MTDFWLKQNDLSPALEATLKDENDNAVDLTSATQVRFHMIEWGASSAKVDAGATIVDAAGGKVKYEWSSGDTDTAGTFKGEFEVTFSGGSIETYPNYTYIEIDITEEIA